MSFPLAKSVGLFVLIVLTALPLRAQDYTCTYQTFGPANAEGQSVNSHDTVVGQIFNSKSQSFAGFIRTANGKLNMVKAPGDQYTFLSGNNDSDVVVGMREKKLGSPYFGFLYHNGQFSAVNYPGATDTYSGGINNKDEIVGGYAADNGNYGFLLKNSKFTSIGYPGANSTSLAAINNHSAMVGFYLDLQLNQHGFTYIGGKFHNVDYPGGNWTGLYGINDSGQIVGVALFQNRRGNVSFVLQNGKFRQITIPKATSIAVGGINNAGDISGWYQTIIGAPTKGFLGTHCH